MRLALRTVPRFIASPLASPGKRSTDRLSLGAARTVMASAGASPVRDSTVVISGGGFSGLGCATELAKAGIDVLIVEQGRGLGGRVATRRTRGEEDFTFDHGCQYFAPKGGEFLELVQKWEQQGLVARWGEGGRLGQVTSTKSADGQTRIDWASYAPNDASKKVWVGLPTMSSIGRHLVAAAGPTLSYSTSTRLAPGSLSREPDGRWRVETHPTGDTQNRTATRHSVVLAAGSASSAFNVISPVGPELAAPAGTVDADCCWALLVAFRSPLFGGAPPLPLDGAMVQGSSSLSWIARDSSKPGRAAGSLDCWVVHATAAWSNPRREQGKSEVVGPLLAEWLRECRRDGAGGNSAAPEIAYVEAHRWNAAFPLNPLSAPERSFWDAGSGLGLCGDWCIGPRSGDAFESGQALARRVLQSGVVAASPSKL